MVSKRYVESEVLVDVEVILEELYAVNRGSYDGELFAFMAAAAVQVAHAACHDVHYLEESADPNSLLVYLDQEFPQSMVCF